LAGDRSAFRPASFPTIFCGKELLFGASLPIFCQNLFLINALVTDFVHCKAGKFFGMSREGAGKFQMIKRQFMDAWAQDFIANTG
jgi:hypothetical protein